jgi:hypothetical protein
METTKAPAVRSHEDAVSVAILSQQTHLQASGEQNVKEILKIRGHKNPDPHKGSAVLASKPSKLAYKHTDACRAKNLHAILN